ncbi:rCG59832 [Rattus norvegicus]|uniref:RCG59832 n=1 Tax=Rattus norvegicus TaxID=10116 RepID=A6HRT3_RAT|nr:rCG59832 [Rattus norvegicus]
MALRCSGGLLGRITYSGYGGDSVSKVLPHEGEDLSLTSIPHVFKSWV